MSESTRGNNNSDLTEMNRSAVVKILQQRGVCSRADIAKEMGLTQASITKIVAVLMEMGIVSEVGIIKGNGNRRSIGIRLNAEQMQVIGVKFARHTFTVGVFDISGKRYTSQETEYCIEQKKEEILSAMKEQVHQMMRHYENVVAIGLALPGPYLRAEGRIAIMTRMPFWRSINFIKELSAEFEVPVFTEQDANAGALAEWWFGKHERPLHTLAYLLDGEGVGAGIVENGSLILGKQGVAGEVGHISVDVHGARCECGNYGCLEMYCSVPALLKKAEERVPELLQRSFANRVDACDAVFDAARNGDKRAQEVVSEIAEYLGFGCVTLINAYNPDIIVLGDCISRGGDLLLPMVRQVVSERTIPELHDKVQIKLSNLKVDSTFYGAAAIAADRILQMPGAFWRKNKTKK